MTGSILRKKLHCGECVYGTHIVSLMNPVAAAMTAELPLDFAFICTEHMPIDRTEVSMMCQYYAARGISPVVRVPAADATTPSAISMAMDAGAQGIVVPYIETAEQVACAVGAVRYRPVKGQQLQQMMNGEITLSEKTREYIDTFNAENYLILGIESMTAIDNLEQLIGVDGVDGVFLGPHDITVSMGLPTEYENPRCLDVIVDVIKRCRAGGVGVGLHFPLFRLQDTTLRRLLDAGMNWLINGADVAIMSDAMKAQLDRLRLLTSEGVASSDDVKGDESQAPAIRTCIN